MKLPALEILLKYKHSHVLKAYAKRYPNHALPAEQAFQEVLKYLWVTVKLAQDQQENPSNIQLPREIGIMKSMIEIDDMWHEFILFTEDYTNFCDEYFGGYMHHLPSVEENGVEPEPPTFEELEKIIGYIYDNLGEDTVRVWFSHYLAHA